MNKRNSHQMKKKFIYIICLSFACTATISAQSIRGTVTDKNQKPIDFATVVLQTIDSIFISSTHTNTAGNFELPTDLQEFRLIVQHLMYETFEKDFSNEFEIVIELIENENMLDEIVVRGERPVVRVIDGRMTFDMPLLLSGTTVSNAYESILRLPGVREQNGRLVLAGANSVTVIINGRATSMPVENLMAALKMYPAEMLQSAEIMYSAPPQYHVRGAVINLILKSETADNNIQGQINSNYTQRYYANYSSGISLLIPSSRLTANISYAFNHNRTRSGVDIFSNHLYNNVVHHIEQFNRGSRQANVHHIRTGFDYKLTESDRLNLTYTSQITGNMDNHERSEGTFSLSDNHRENISPIQMHNILLDYSSGFGLRTGVEYTSYRNRTNQHFLERMTGRENEFIAEQSQNINRFRFFADQTHSLSSGFTFTYGAQYMHATDRSSQIYNSLVDNDMSGLNMNSHLTEHTASSYIGLSRRFGSRLSARASIAGEYYKLADFEEWTLFPTLEMTYLMSPTQIMQLSFSSDRVYPSYWEMHGAISYLNGYSEIHGNPLLRPYRTYSGQLSYILNSKYILTAYYNYLNGFSAQLPFQASDRLALIYQTLNFDYKQTVGLNLIIPFSIGQTVNSRLTQNGFYDRVKASHFHNTSFLNDIFVYYARLDNTITISKKPNIRAEVNGMYITRNIQGPAELTPLLNLEAGIRWTFANDRAELRLRGTDLFNSWTPDMTMRYDTQNLRMNIVPDSRAVSLSFVYRFGGYNRTQRELDTSRFGVQ
jgi:hypothetical protein